MARSIPSLECGHPLQTSPGARAKKELRVKKDSPGHEVTRCTRSSSGGLTGVGGDGWLIEPELMAADIVAAGPGLSPYYVRSSNGDPHQVTVQKAETGSHFALSTTNGDRPLKALPAS